MTDDLETTAEVEETPAAEQGESESASEDTQDVGALMRALEREREERKTAKEELRRLREDEDARAELLAQWGYEVTDDEADDEEDGDEFEEEPEPDPTVQWLLQKESERQYDRDLGELLGGREFPDAETEKNVKGWIQSRTLHLGNNRKALEQAVKEFETLSDQLAPKNKKKAPHTAKGGQPGTGVKDWSQMSEDEINAHMVERARALAAEQ